MRVIAGKAKGRILIAPKGMETRPITSQIKEALFNIWQTQIVDASLLDLFAGSGSIGIEAISRGAKQVVFMEQSRKAVDVIKKNLAVCDFTDGYMIYRDDVFKGLMRLKEEGYAFDLIYLDPPFTAGEIFLPVMEVLSYADILVPDGEVAIRTPKNKELPNEIGNLKRAKMKRYGVSNVHFFKSMEDAE